MTPDVDRPEMDWIEALEVVVANTRHEPFRAKCAEDNPNIRERDGFRRHMIRMATGLKPERPTPSQGPPPSPSPSQALQYPPLAARATNLAGSLWRFVRSGLKLTPRAEVKRRQAICRTCDKFDPARRKCTLCGCPTSIKPWLRNEHCPLPANPKW